MHKTIGILGGGQLGRMTALAAAQLGVECRIFSPVEDSPACQVTRNPVIADYEDQAALQRFAEQVDVVGLEFENVPVASLEFLANHVPVHPGAALLNITQDRLLEKQFVQQQGFATAAYRDINNADDLTTALQALNGGILKTRRFGYDGKGQLRLPADTDATAAWAELGQQPAILEALVPFTAELSVIVARTKDSDVATWQPARNIHENGILKQSIVPGGFTDNIVQQARNIATSLASAAGLIGLLAVELFLTTDNQLLVNELAPRPHNSGHWTMDGAMTCQFEQYVRCLVGFSLGSTSRVASNITMHNLLGEEVYHAAEWLAQSRAKVHLYGKKEVTPGRKLGHVNVVEE